MNLFNLFATLTLDNSDYEKKLDQSQKSAKSFSSGIGTAFKTGARAVAGLAAGVAAATTAIAALAVKFVNAGSEIDDNAQKLGISTEAYQYWSLVLQRAGSDASQLSMAIRNMTTFTQELSTGQADALLTLQKLGIGYEEFMAMSTEEQLYAIVEALQGMEDQTEKVQIAQDIFGSRVYQELLPLLNMEQGSLEDLREEFEGLGFILSENTIKNIAALGDKFDNFINTIKTTGLVIASNLLPEIELITDGLMGLATGSDDAMQALTDGLVGLIDKIAKALPSIISVAGDLLLQILVGLTDVLSDPNIINGLVNVIESLLFKIVDLLPTLTKSIAKIAVSFIKALLKIDWGELLLNLINALLDIVINVLPAALGDLLSVLWDTVMDFFTGKSSGSSDDGGSQSIWDMIVGFFTGKNSVKKPSDVLANYEDNRPEGGGGGARAKGGMITNFAAGGLFGKYDYGSVYIAGEAGAEVVAHGPRGTGVANIEQIADAQYMAMSDYDLRGAIQRAAAAIVNGIVDGLSNTAQDSGNTPVVIRIGDKDFSGYIVNTVNNTLRSQGRKSLNRVTSY